MEDKRIEVSLHASAKAKAARIFKHPTPGRSDGGNADILNPQYDNIPKDMDQKDKYKRENERRTRHARTRSPSPRQRADGVHRRADSCNRASEYMRHRVRLSWRELGETRRERANPIAEPKVSIPFKNNNPPPRFSQGVSLLDATTAQTEFVYRELARFVQAWALEPSNSNDYASRLFLVPKPGNNQWRLICDLRPQNKYRVRKRLKMERY
jgi:hypothetical protein